MMSKFKKILAVLLLFPGVLCAQINTDRVMTIARNALYFEDYVLSIQYFNEVINAKPYLYEPYYFRALAKINLDDYVGAEEDCNEAIQRDPFVVSAYQIRGLARIRQGNFDGAIDDYKKALKYNPENTVLWYNMALCHIQKKDYIIAKEDIERLLEVSPNYTRAYLMRGEISLMQKDTITAMKDIDVVIKMDRFDADAWSMRAVIKLQQGKYKDAETDFNQAIHNNVDNSGNYINRALARFHQNNLRGAMNDYDTALNLDPNNFIGHYNRGLLRAQVGDDNRALEDFDFVLKIDSNDMMATFNRGILRAQTGNYRGAIADYTKVISKYPNFLTGYSQRAQARRKIGDKKGADKDDYIVMKMQLDKSYGISNGGVGKNKKNTADSGNKTRKKSNKDMNNYRKIVIADESEQDRKYKSDYRGRVQDKNVIIKLKSMYALTYYEKVSGISRSIHYDKFIDSLNHSNILPLRLLITDAEAPLTKDQIKFHFALIDAHTSAIVAESTSAPKRFARAMDFYLVQDFTSAVSDLTKSILLDESFFPAYFMRALIRCKQLEYEKSEQNGSRNSIDKASVQREVDRVDYDVIIKDLDKVISIDPDFVYSYYNRGNIFAMLKDYRAAINDYTKAIQLNPDLAEAYYNRGLTHIFLGENKLGINDLSRAGELGIASAYNIIKRFTDQQE